MSSALLIAATLILLAGVVDDFVSRKVHNWLFLTCAAVGFGISILLGGFSGFNTSMLGFAAGLVAFLPLVLFRMIGAGDMKLLAAFGAAAGWNPVFDVVVFSLIWGAIFGITQVVMKGQFTSMVKNMATITGVKVEGAKKRGELELHKIPFTAAMLLGWLTHLTLKGFV